MHPSLPIRPVENDTDACGGPRVCVYTSALNSAGHGTMRRAPGNTIACSIVIGVCVDPGAVARADATACPSAPGVGAVL